MAPPSVELEITGIEAATAMLRGVGNRIGQPLTPLLESVADLWTTDFQANFERQGFDGEPWTELAPFTQKVRKARGFGSDRPILVRTSDLLQSIGIQSQGDDEIEVGTNLRYAAVLQFGGIETWHEDVPGTREIPARPFVGLTEELLADTTEAIEAYFFGEGASA